MQHGFKRLYATTFFADRQQNKSDKDATSAHMVRGASVILNVRPSETLPSGKLPLLVRTVETPQSSKLSLLVRTVFGLRVDDRNILDWSDI